MPFGASCTSSAGSCTFDCGGGVTYDLSPLKPGFLSSDTHAQDKDHHDVRLQRIDRIIFDLKSAELIILSTHTHNSPHLDLTCGRNIPRASSSQYYWRACGTKPHTKCTSSAVTEIAAVQTWPDTASGEDGVGCAVIGDASKASCSPADSANPTKGLKCDYTGGDGGRDVTISWLCAAQSSAPTAASTGSLSYSLTHHHPAGCGKGGPGPGPGPGPSASSPTPPSPSARLGLGLP